jgi:hypothetical protein
MINIVNIQLQDINIYLPNNIRLYYIYVKIRLRRFYNWLFV